MIITLLVHSLIGTVVFMITNENDEFINLIDDFDPATENTEENEEEENDDDEEMTKLIKMALERPDIYNKRI